MGRRGSLPTAGTIFENGCARFMTPLVLWQAKKKLVSDQDHLRSLVKSAATHYPSFQRI